MHLFVNSLAASAGGGLTYVRNVIPHLAAQPGLRVTVVMPPNLRQEFAAYPDIDFIEMEIPPARRFWYEQSRLPQLIRQSGADVLLSSGNFALRKSPVPQILLSRNSIYTSADFYHDLRSRHEYRQWLDTHIKAVLAKRSIRWADVSVAPSEAFAGELRHWTGKPIRAIHHGFDLEAFTRDPNPLTAEVEAKLESAEGSLKLLFVSHYNYYRNFETLLRAMPLVRERMLGRSTTGRPVQLLLTCKLMAGENPGSYRPESAANLVNDLGISEMVIELGAIPYSRLHRVYRRADIYVTPAYTETFAHPLVEAMASGLPVVASDLPVHREICGGAALYFSRFSPAELATRVVEIASSTSIPEQLVVAGSARAKEFSWRKHTLELLSLAASLLATARKRK